MGAKKELSPPQIRANSARIDVVNIVASILIMCCAGSVYAWSIFVGPLQEEYGLSTASTQLIFGCIIGSFTITMLFVGRIERKSGPKITAAIGAVLFSFGYLLASFSGGNPLMILLGIGIISGAGMGFGYVTVLSTLVKWFPNRKGLVTGIAVAGFGSGAILLSQIVTPFLNNGMTITSIFRSIGIIYGIIFFICALFISAPVSRGVKKIEKPVGVNTLVRDKRFWILFYTFFAGSFAGLMFIGNLKNIGLSYGISESAAVLAIVIVSVGNALGRIFWGQIYDRIGGKRSVGIALALLSVFTLILLLKITNDASFLILCFVIGLCYGANFVLYASDVSNIYGINQVGIIYPVVSLAYGISGIVGPFAGGLLFDITNAYLYPLLLAAAICLTGMAIYILSTSKPGYAESKKQHFGVYKNLQEPVAGLGK